MLHPSRNSCACGITATITLVIIATSFVTCNIYFPELYEDNLYKPINLGPTPLIYQTVSQQNTTLVEWALIKDVIWAHGKFSEDAGPTNCTLAKISLTNVTSDVCKSVQNAILVRDYIYLLSVHCKTKNRAVLIQLSNQCLEDYTPARNWEIIYTAFDNTRELHLHLVGNKSGSLLVWLKNSQFYSIINAQNWPDSKIQLESNLVIGELQNEIQISDVAGSYDNLYVFSDTCLYSCPLTGCRVLEVVTDR